MRNILVSVLVLLLVSCRDQSRTVQTEKFTLDFRKGHNLKLVYDAGVRPWRHDGHPYPGLDSSCYVGKPGFDTDDQELNYWTVLLPGGEQFSIATSYVKFQVLEDFDIARIDFRGTVRDARDAAIVAKRICAAMNIPVVESPEAMVADAASKVAWNSTITSSDVRFTIAFWVGAHAFRGSDNVCLEWRDYKPKEHWKAPLKKPINGIRSPPGYEGVSMQPPWRVR